MQQGNPAISSAVHETWSDRERALEDAIQPEVWASMLPALRLSPNRRPMSQSRSQLPVVRRKRVGM